ncbi:MAG: sulfite exporter TauE/SafE family protein [Pseudomonadota bacterium]
MDDRTIRGAYSVLMLLLNSLLPDGLSILSALFLVAAAFVTSAMTAAFGIGGGVALLAVMASIVPVAVLIPVHGVVQAASNISRAVVERRHVVWPLIGTFSLGAFMGALIGGQLVVSLPDTLLKVLVGCFVLFSVWGGRITSSGHGPFGLAVGGMLASILTMFVGATGPFVAALLASRLEDRRNYNGTHAAAMVIQHGLKIVTFGLLGFAFGAWLPLMAGMIVAAFLGAPVGSRLMHAMPEERFRTIFKWVLTALAIQLLVSGMIELVG